MENTDKLAVDFKTMCEIMSCGANVGYRLHNIPGFPRIKLTPKKSVYPVHGENGLLAWLDRQSQDGRGAVNE